MSRETPFSLWLRQRRKALDLTQKDLAAMAGCSPESLRKVEAGVLRPSRQLAELLALHLEVSPENWPAFVQFARDLTGSIPDALLADLPVGVEPSAAAGGPPVSEDFSTASRETLPVSLTQLIGREEDMDVITNLLERHDVRLLTLTGPPGVGKTRLALEIVAGLLDSFRDGVTFLPLAPVSEPDLLAAAIAEALDMQQMGGISPPLALKSYLRDKQALLLLDNFEHLIPAAPVVADLLASCPKIKVLATSRAALNIRAERQYVVQPLALPDPDQPLSPEELGTFASVRLFVERAQAAEFGFDLTGANAEDVAAVCRRLDGLPLALELAAPRLTFLSPHSLLSRLESRLKLLTSGAQDLPQRQQTLMATIDWSYDLLFDDERKAFRRLALFQGGATLEAAEAVCNLGDLDVSVLDLMASLVNKSLLKRETVPGGEPRLNMLETLREYALQKLAESDETDGLHRRYLGFFTDLAERSAPGLLSADQALWMQRLVAEHDNMRAALRLVTSAGDAEPAMRLVGALSRFWELGGHWNEGFGWFKQALTLDGPVSTLTQAKALAGCGSLALYVLDIQDAIGYLEKGVRLWEEVGDGACLASTLRDLAIAYRDLGNLDESERLCRRSMELCREAADSAGIAASLYELGTVADGRGDISLARDLFKQCLELNRSLGLRIETAAALFRLGYTAHLQSKNVEALAYFAESIALRRELGLKGGLAQALTFLGRVVRDEGDYTQALTLFEESLALHRRLGDRISISSTLNSLGEMFRLQGDYDRALALYEEGLQICLETGFKQGIGVNLQNLGHLALRRSEYSEASSLFRDALKEFDEMGSKRDCTLCMLGLAGVSAALGEHVRAARLLGVVNATLTQLGASLRAAEKIEYQSDLELAAAGLSESDFAQAWEEGQTLSYEQAKELAMR